MKSAEISGPWRFRLRRVVDASGVSGTGYVADGVRFADGTCVLRWTTSKASTAVYADHETLMDIHGHNGATVCEWVDHPPTEAFKWGAQNCVLDVCENVPFASIGGLDKRAKPEAPAYVPEADRADYLRGYEAAAVEAIGEDWRTCTFRWRPAMRIG